MNKKLHFLYKRKQSSHQLEFHLLYLNILHASSSEFKFQQGICVIAFCNFSVLTFVVFSALLVQYTTQRFTRYIQQN